MARCELVTLGSGRRCRKKARVRIWSCSDPDHSSAYCWPHYLKIENASRAYQLIERSEEVAQLATTKPDSE